MATPTGAYCFMRAWLDGGKESTRSISGHVSVDDGFLRGTPSSPIMRIASPFLVWRSWALRSADSIAWAISKAFFNARSGSDNSLRCIRPSSIPQTNRSRSTSGSVSPNPQCSDSRLNSATKAATDSPPFRKREWRTNLWTITEGLGSRCLTSFTISSNDFSVGTSGASRFLISWYVRGPQQLSRMAFFFPSPSISLAEKCCCSLSVYDAQSSTPWSNSLELLDGKQLFIFVASVINTRITQCTYVVIINKSKANKKQTLTSNCNTYENWLYTRLSKICSCNSIYWMFY